MTTKSFIKKLEIALSKKGIELYCSDGSIKHPEQVISEISKYKYGERAKYISYDLFKPKSDLLKAIKEFEEWESYQRNKK